MVMKNTKPRPAGAPGGLSVPLAALICREPGRNHDGLRMPAQRRSEGPAGHNL
jgi:hypothetical protein